MSPRELVATKVSRKILSRLTPVPWPGKVAAIFERSLNLTMKDDFLIHIGSDKLSLTPRTISLSEKDFHERLLPGCSLGQPTCIVGEHLYQGRTKIHLSHPQTYRYEPIMRLEERLLASQKISGHLISALRKIAAAREDLKELFVSPLHNYFLSRTALVGLTHAPGISKSRRWPLETEISLQIRKAIWERADGFLQALRQEKWSEAGKFLRGLIGLGPGLTPSGDDFLAGFILAGAIWRERLGEPVKLTKDIAAMVRKWAQGRTTAVSRAMLEDATEGEASEPVQRFLMALFKKGKSRETRFWAMEISRTGASSGEDLLNGLACGILFFKRQASSEHKKDVLTRNSVSF